MWRSPTVTRLTPHIAALAVALGVALAPAEEAPNDRPPATTVERDPAEVRRRLAELDQAFRALPPSRQEQLRQLDRSYADLSPDARRKLDRALDEYNRWLARLPEADRRRVLDAPGSNARLKVVHDIRQKQAVAALPRKQREQLDAAAPADRPKLLEKFLREHRRVRKEQSPPTPRWDEPPAVRLPSPFDADPPRRDLWRYVKEVLRPQLDAAEQDRLWMSLMASPSEDARDFLETVADLADRHPQALPGPSTGPGYFGELPPAVQEVLAPMRRLAPGLRERLESAPKGWPAYAVAVTRIAREYKIELPQQLGPCRPADFNRAPWVRPLIERLLKDPTAAERLRKAEGHWPDYPEALAAEAARLGLPVPGQRPPGPEGFWERYRKKN
jgi:hypothetical protein